MSVQDPFRFDQFSTASVGLSPVVAGQGLCSYLTNRSVSCIQAVAPRSRGSTPPDREKPMGVPAAHGHPIGGHADRKSTRLNSSHLVISYAVFCLKKKK